MFGKDSIKKPFSIRETMDAEEREKSINGTDNALEIVVGDNNDGCEDWFSKSMQWFEENTPLTSFVDAKGNVGVNGSTYKYPMPFEFIVEHLEYAGILFYLA